MMMTTQASMILTPLLSFPKILRTGPQRIHSCIRSRRALLTQAIEPDPSSSVPEKPCTLILSEELDLYGGSSWHSTFQQRFPAEFGITYRHWSMDPARTSTVDDALSQLMEDLAGIPDAVLVARGPWLSWLSQFFLESLPLKGLVMVDPVPLDAQHGIDVFQALYKEASCTKSLEYCLFLDFAMHWDHWTLRLEPGSVPMLVLVTSPRPELRNSAEDTARRHSLEEFGDTTAVVPLEVLSSHDRGRQAEEAIAAVANWIQLRAL